MKEREKKKHFNSFSSISTALGRSLYRMDLSPKARRLVKGCICDGVSATKSNEGLTAILHPMNNGWDKLGFFSYSHTT